MAEENYGDIHQYSSFIWDIPDFNSILEKEDCHLESPEFEFEEDTWLLLINKMDNCGVTCFGLATSSSAECAQTYRLSIKDFKGNDYWTSAVLIHEFCDDSDGNRYQGVLDSCLKRDIKKIAPNDILSLHLTFFSGDGPPREDAVLSDNDPHHPNSSKTDVGSKTCTNSLCSRGCSTNSSGLENLGLNLKDLLVSGNNSDVTLVVKGKEFKVHQTILLARSPVFHTMLNQKMLEQASGAIEITDCDPEAFQDFLHYLYSGRVTVLVKSVVELFSIAYKYNVNGLTSICVDFMVSNLSVDSFCDFAQLGFRHLERKLADAADKFFAENVKEIVSTPQWRDFNAQNANEATDLLVKALC